MTWPQRLLLLVVLLIVFLLVQEHVRRKLWNRRNAGRCPKCGKLWREHGGYVEPHKLKF